MQRLKLAIWQHKRLFHFTQFFLIAYRRSLMNAFRFFRGIDEKTVVFSSFDFKNYNDNPRAVSEKLHEMCPGARIVWLVRRPAEFRGVVPGYVILRRAISARAFGELACAKFWVDNFSKRPYLRFVRGRQYYINTWHGDRPFKRIVYDTVPPSEYRLEEDASLLVSGSGYGDRMYRSAFHYKGEILSTGMPRNDALVNADPREARRVREALGIPDGARLLLYAPTFRLINLDTDKRQNTDIDIPRVLDDLEAKTGEKWLCLYRTHYFMPGLNLKTDMSRMVDVTRYREMSDLLLASDVLLTDYSSCAGDFALLRRPILLYQPDREEYAAHDRGLYFDPDTSPFFIARTQEGLTRLIEKLDPEAAAANCDEINAFFESHESGRASEDVCRWIMERMK